MKRRNKQLQIILSFALLLVPIFQFVQAVKSQDTAATDKNDTSARLYRDVQNGMIADEAVKIALENNGEIQAMRKEAEAARSMVKQAGLRANPKIEANGTREIGGMGDNSVMVEGMLPLELGGRRAARVRVANAELEIRESALANQERLLAAEVRTKFGEALAEIEKLELLEKILANSRQGYDIVAAKVTEG